MCDRYDAEDGHDGETTLDELLCEYVDGTMDPGVREVFEEVLAADPDLAVEVRELCCTREMLCHYGCHRPPPLELEMRFRQRLNSALAHEAMREQTPVLSGTSAHLATLATVVSAAALTLTLGLCVAALQLDHQAAASRTVPAVSFYDPGPQSPVHRATPLRFSTTVGVDRTPLLPASATSTRLHDVAFLQRSAVLLDGQP